MNLNLDSAQLSSEQLPELVRQLVACNVRLRAEIEELKRKNARSAAPFSKNKHQKNLQLPGRKAGQGPFSNNTAPLEEHYTGPIEDVPVTPPACLDCGGELTGENEEIVTNTEILPAPKPEIKAYRIHLRSCSRCKRKVRGHHPDVAPDQHGAAARAQAAAAMLHYGDGIPQRKVPGVLKSLTGLSMTQGVLAQAAICHGTSGGLVAR